MALDSAVEVLGADQGSVLWSPLCDRLVQRFEAQREVEASRPFVVLVVGRWPPGLDVEPSDFVLEAPALGSRDQGASNASAMPRGLNAHDEDLGRARIMKLERKEASNLGAVGIHKARKVIERRDIGGVGVGEPEPLRQAVKQGRAAGDIVRSESANQPDESRRGLDDSLRLCSALS